MLDFTPQEKKLFKKLNTPAKVQDFLNSLKFNFEKKGGKKVPTLKSPLFVLKEGNAHCIEGAILGAYILSRYGSSGFTPYLMHLKATKDDFDHVIAPFRIGKFWGALSKTNHAVLRYREPIYKNIRELAMSYFHEYFLDSKPHLGEKTLRQYSALLNLNDFEPDWPTHTEDLWGIDEELDKIRHYDIVPKAYVKKLRKVDKIEIKAGNIAEWKK